MADLPDDFADNPQKYDQSIETLAGAPDGPKILADGQANAQRADQAELELKLLRDKYDLHSEEDSFPNLCQEGVDQEVYNRQEWAVSEEGAQALREGVMQEWSHEPKSRSSDDVYKETFTQRKQREYAEEQARKRESE